MTDDSKCLCGSDAARSGCPEHPSRVRPWDPRWLKRRRTFITRVLDGDVADPHAEIDDEVSDWHEGGTGLELHEYLGMTWDEYGRWTADPKNLDAIIDARRAANDETARVSITGGDATARVSIVRDDESVAYCPMQWGGSETPTSSDRDVWIYHRGIYHAFVRTEQWPWRSRCGNHVVHDGESKTIGAPRCQACEEATNSPRPPEWEGTLANQVVPDSFPHPCTACLPRLPEPRGDEEVDWDRMLTVSTIGERSPHPHPRIRKVGDVAVVHGTQMPVWLLWYYHGLGVALGQITRAYTYLSADDVAAAWAYVADHKAEIDALVDAADIRGVPPTSAQQRELERFEVAHLECAEALGLRAADLIDDDVRAWLELGRPKQTAMHAYFVEWRHGVEHRVCAACKHTYRADETRTAGRICVLLSHRQSKARAP